MSTEMTLHATLTTGMRFDVETPSGNHVLVNMVNQDTPPGSGSGPMETLLAALAGCSGISMLSLLQKKRQDVTHYAIHVHGKQAETYPHVFTEIHVEHVLTGHALQEMAVQRSLQLTEERYCSVSIMLSKATELTQTFRIIEAPKEGH